VRDIKALIFDLDDTLWDVGPVILRAEQAMMRLLSEQYPRVLEMHTLESMRELRARMALEHPAMRHDFTWLRTQALLLHAREAGYPDSMAIEAFEVFYRVRNEVVPYDDVLPALEWLSARYRMFAVSNGNADLHAIGLSSYFERSLAARDAGMLKPDPRIFAMLLEAGGVRAAEVLHVGDDPKADVEGARSAGIRPVWVNRRGLRWPDEFSPPEHAVGSLAELVTLLAGVR